MRIKLDENLPAQLVAVLTALGHDVEIVVKKRSRSRGPARLLVA